MEPNTVVAPSAAVPATSVALPPWTLRGEGVVFFVRAASAEPEVRPILGKYACVMFVDYAASPVGPYRELLYIPGTLPFGGRRYPTISRIYVSSQASVDSGRHNWCIPKELADFSVTDERRVRDITVSCAGSVFARLRVRRGYFALPVSTALLPARVRTLGQALDGRACSVAPSASGFVQRARVMSAWSDGVRFPELSERDVSLAARTHHVRLAFPVARPL